MRWRGTAFAAALLLAPGLAAAGGAPEPPADPAAAGASAGSAGAAGILAALPPDLVQQLYDQKVVLLPKLDTGARVQLDPAAPAAAAESETTAGSDDLVEAVVLFDQPRRRVIRLLSQTARQVEFRPELKGIDVLQWYDDGDVEEHRMRIMLIGIRYHLRNHLDVDGSRIWWQLDPDFENDLRDVSGFWQLYDLDEKRTLARFGTKVDVGPALPAFLQDYATRKNVPQTMDHVRRWVDSNGTWRP